jgi:hypothetical protein
MNLDHRDQEYVPSAQIVAKPCGIVAIVVTGIVFAPPGAMIVAS